ncbi:SpdD protein [Streptomyces sp. NPDC055099]
MFKPKYPTPDTYPTITTAVPPATDRTPAPALQPVPLARTSAAVELVKSNPVLVVAGLVVGGLLLTSMFLAIAITAGSLALLAVVIRSLMNDRR